MAQVSLTEEHVRWFRAQRLGLVDSTMVTASSVAARLLGAQAQVESCALHGLSARMHSPATASDIAAELSPAGPLVRCWGQRDTMHIYAIEDWPLIIAAQVQWKQSGRRIAPPPDDVIAAGLDRMHSLARPVSREDLFDVMPDAYVEMWQTALTTDRNTALRYATGRIFWVLCRRGDACAAGKSGSQQLYVARNVWYPELAWSLPDSHEANVCLTRRFLALSGPATVTDVAYHFGSNVGDARPWVEALAAETVEVSCGERKGLLALSADLDALREPVGEWPTRMLPAYDMKWMSHKDKTWVTPLKSDEKLVWRKAARVTGCLVHRGQPVACWTAKKRSKAIDVTLEPLSGWSETLLADAQAESHRYAEHLGKREATVKVA